VKKGFTIVELLMVVGIIAALMGLVTSAASESIRGSRIRKAESVCKLVEAGFANYYAQYGKWPGTIGGKIENGSLGSRSNDDGAQSGNDSEEYELTTSEMEECIRAMIDETKKGNPVMDISGLFVCKSDHNVEPQAVSCNCAVRNHKRYVARNVNGLDFMTAIHGTKRSPQKMSTRSMHFGYPHPDNGRFMPFRVIYSIPTDSITVKQWHWPGVSW